ncbi:MAG: flavin reductase family protein [Saccharospirillaceae bacterium]|nr:flavin reductase family protein [Pseudomonadales bacterium]NRB80467.1 flavin reductase family protein [Saccharospirillaceae bacterium]
MNINFEKISSNEAYFAMVQTIIPRPIAWVLTQNNNQTYNLAPFSFFTGICSDPPLVMLSAGKKPSGNEKGQNKDTRQNIIDDEYFVIHIASTDQLKDLNNTAATLDYGQSEITANNIELTDFKIDENNQFKLPRIKNCPVAIACKLHRIDEIGNTAQAVIYGEIKAMYINDKAINLDNKTRLEVDSKKINPLAKLGGPYYSALGETFKVIRPK